jgi:hypothetical protein
MDSALCYVIGYPASGKTTALSSAITAPVATEHTKPFKHITYEDGIVQIGANRPLFGGTDALPFSVQPTVLKWLPEAQSPVIVGEGDRLCNNKFFNAVIEMGLPLKIVYIEVPELLARYRAWKRGHELNEIWFKGRRTKVDRVAGAWEKYVTRIDGRLDAWRVARDLRDCVYG